jgi:hypothetical protein
VQRHQRVCLAKKGRWVLALPMQTSCHASRSPWGFKMFFFEKKLKEDSLFDSVFIKLIIRVGLLLASGDTSVAPAGSSARVALLLARTAALQNLIKQLMCAFVGEGLFSQKKVRVCWASGGTRLSDL